MDRNIGRRSTPRRPMNMQTGSSKTEEGLKKTYTKQEVKILLTDRFKGPKFDSKGKQEWTSEYIKRLKACLKCLLDVVDEKDGLQTALKSQEEEISKLERNISSLSQSLEKEESEKLGALDGLKKEKEKNMGLEKNQESLRKELGWAEQSVLNANVKVKMYEELNTHLQNELREAKQQLSRLRGAAPDNTFDAPPLNGSKPAADPFSLLHGDILLDIMGRIECTTKQLIRTTSSISKRWQNLWCSVPHLIFLWMEDGVADDLDNKLHCYISFIDNTINQCPPTTYPNLKLFKLDTNYTYWKDTELERRVCNWIDYAIRRNVEELDIRIWGGRGEEGEFIYDDDLLFKCSCITRMKLSWCLLEPPNGVISWARLELLCISCGTLDEDILEMILSGSPCLETLELEDCYGYERIDITSKSVKKLVFSGYNSHHEIARDEDYIDGVKINAPYLSSLFIKGELVLREFALENVSSLVKSDFDYSIDWRGEVSREEIFRGLADSVIHVKDAIVGDHFSEFLSRWKASRDISNDDPVESEGHT